MVSLGKYSFARIFVCGQRGCREDKSLEVVIQSPGIFERGKVTSKTEGSMCGKIW